MTPTTDWTAVVNSVTGDRMVFLHRGTDAEGDVLEVQFDLPPHASGSPMHRHTRISERFEVLDGALRLSVDGQGMTLLAGDSVTVTPGQSHRFLNESNAWVTFITEIRPPARFERFLRTWYGLANAGHSTAAGVPRNVFHLARCLQDADLTFAGAPVLLQRVAIAALVAIGHAVGSYAALMDYDTAPAPSRLASARS